MKKKLLIAAGLFAIALSSCGVKNTIEDKQIIVGASTSPHAEILEQTEEYINSKGYTLKIVEFDDYIMPNKGVSEGSLDANYFQHLPYLEDYNNLVKLSIFQLSSFFHILAFSYFKHFIIIIVSFMIKCCI